VVCKDIKDLEKVFGKMRTQHGPKITFLGINFNFSIKGKVIVEMISYLNKIIKEFNGKVWSFKTPARENLFQVNKNSSSLLSKGREHFHHIVVKLLFVIKRARPDLHTAVSFMTTQVLNSTEQDSSKLKRIIGYLNSTLHLVLTLEVNSAIICKWWINAAFGVHIDFKSHIGTTFC